MKELDLMRYVRMEDQWLAKQAHRRQITRSDKRYATKRLRAYIKAQHGHYQAGQPLWATAHQTLTAAGIKIDATKTAVYAYFQQPVYTTPAAPKPAPKRTPETPKYAPTPAAATDAFLNSYEWRKVRMQALKKHGARCQCCGATPATGAQMNVDHIKPRKLFPQLALDIENLQVLCGECNHGKGNWDMTDWRENHGRNACQ